MFSRQTTGASKTNRSELKLFLTERQRRSRQRGRSAAAKKGAMGGQPIRTLR